VYHHAHCVQNMGVISVSSTQLYATLSTSMVRKPSTMHRISTGDLADTRICTDAPSKLGSICVVAGQDCQLCPRVSNRPFECLSAALKLAVVFTWPWKQPPTCTLKRGAAFINLAWLLVVSQHFCNLCILPGSANQCILGNGYLRCDYQGTWYSGDSSLNLTEQRRLRHMLLIL